MEPDSAAAFDLDEQPDAGASGSTQRDMYLLRWADQLQADEGVWRIVLHYLAFVMSSKNVSLADIAEERMRAVLRHVKWRDPTVPSASAAGNIDAPLGKLVNGNSDEQEKEQGEEKQETSVEDVLKACYEYGFEDVAVELCKVSWLFFSPLPFMLLILWVSEIRRRRKST